MTVDLLRQGDLATWSSPEAALLALADPDAAREGAPLVDGVKLPAETRAMWVTALTGWWWACQDANALYRWLGQRARTDGHDSSAHRSWVLAACVCARFTLEGVPGSDRAEIGRLVEAIAQWVRQGRAGKPAAYIRLRLCDLCTSMNSALAAVDAAATAAYSNAANNENASDAVDHAVTASFLLTDTNDWEQARTESLRHLAKLIRAEVSLHEVLP